MLVKSGVWNLSISFGSLGNHSNQLSSIGRVQFCSIQQYHIGNIYTLDLGIWQLCCLSEVYKVINSCENSIDRMIWVINHLLNFLVLIQKVISGWLIHTFEIGVKLQLTLYHLVFQLSDLTELVDIVVLLLLLSVALKCFQCPLPQYKLFLIIHCVGPLWYVPYIG